MKVALVFRDGKLSEIEVTERGHYIVLEVESGWWIVKPTIFASPVPRVFCGLGPYPHKLDACKEAQMKEDKNIANGQPM